MDLTLSFRPPFRQAGTRLRRMAAAALASGGIAAAAPASALVLDDFSAPAPSFTRVVQGPAGSSTTVNESGLPVPGGARDTTLHVYGNPLNSASAVSVGEGRLSVAQGTKAVAEAIVAYGAFTRVGGDPTVGGPRFGLDMSAFKKLRFEFSGAEDGLNVNVTYYTSAPLDPSAPLYYTTSGINVAVPMPGMPVTFTLPANNNPAFNWKKVDGIVVLINRSGPTPHTSYTLDRLVFEP